MRRRVIALFIGVVASSALLAPIARAAAPLNDDLAAATEVSTFPFSAALDLTTATVEAGEPTTCEDQVEPIAHSVWYRYTPAADGKVYFDTYYSDYAPFVSVFTGSTYEDLVPRFRCFVETQFYSTFTVTAGTTYFIQLGVLDGKAATAVELHLLDATSPGQVSGTVTDKTTGNPIGGICVWFYDLGGWVGGVETAADGTWEWPDLNPKRYWIDFLECYMPGLEHPSRKGYEEQVWDPDPSTPEQELVDINGGTTYTGIDAAMGGPPAIIGVSCYKEYVDVRNTSKYTKDFTGWKIHDFGKVNVFKFPSGFKLGPGKAVRIWSAGKSGGPYPKWITWKDGPVWNNSGDRARLRDPDGTLIRQRVCDDAGGP